MRATHIAASVSASALALGSLVGGFAASAGVSAPESVQQRTAAVGPTTQMLDGGTDDNNGNG